MYLNDKMYTCMARTVTPFAKLLEDKFLEWERGEGVRKALFEFAMYLGVNRPTLSMWMNGKRSPQDKDMIDNLAIKLGGDVYDALGLPRPDPDTTFVAYHMADLSPEERRAVVEKVKQYLKDHVGE